MNHLHPLIIGIIILSTSCKDNSKTPSNSIKNSEATELDNVPIHKEIQFFISQYPNKGGSGSITPNLYLDDLTKSRWSMSYTPENIPSNKYELTAKYLGSSKSADKYEIDLVYPTDKEKLKAQFSIDYVGNEIVIYKNSGKAGYAVGIKPKKLQNKSQ